MMRAGKGFREALVRPLSSSAAPSHLGDGVLWPDPFSGRPGAAATYSNFNMRWGIAMDGDMLCITDECKKNHLYYPKIRFGRIFADVEDYWEPIISEIDAIVAKVTRDQA